MSDLVVVGSGAAGATIAGFAARQGASVILLEGAPAVSTPPGANIRNAHPGEPALEQQARVLRAARAAWLEGDAPMPGLPNIKVFYGVGGMLTQWVGNCPEPDPMTERPSCIPYDEWLGLVARARSLLRVSADLANGGVRQARLAARVTAVAHVEGARPIQAMPVAATRGSSGILYHGADVLLGGPDLAVPSTMRILPDTVAVRILRRGGRAVGVEAVDRSDRARRRIEARAVVVAAGTIGTARLMVASGIDAGPALGRYLMDHPSVQSTVRLHPDIVRGAPPDDPMFMVWIPFAPKRPWHGMIHRSYPWAAPERPPTADEAFASAELRTLTSIDPEPSNALHFDADHPDVFGLPAVSGEMRLSEGDRRAVDVSVGAHRRLAAAIEDPSHPTQIEVKDSMPRGAPHLTGSHRMGPADDGTSVADPWGRVWSTPGLHVGGNGILPGPSSCNPALSVVAVAIRTAERILSELGSPDPAERVPA